MGFLTAGAAYDWEHAQPFLKYVSDHGITQFLTIYHKHVRGYKKALRFGDEIEYTLIHLDKEKREVKLLLRGPELLDKLQIEEKEQPARYHYL